MIWNDPIMKTKVRVSCEINNILDFSARVLSVGHYNEALAEVNDSTMGLLAEGVTGWVRGQ